MATSIKNISRSGRRHLRRSGKLLRRAVRKVYTYTHRNVMRGALTVASCFVCANVSNDVDVDADGAPVQDFDTAVMVANERITGSGEIPFVFDDTTDIDIEEKIAAAAAHFFWTSNIDLSTILNLPEADDNANCEASIELTDEEKIAAAAAQFFWTSNIDLSTILNLPEADDNANCEASIELNDDNGPSGGFMHFLDMLE